MQAVFVMSLILYIRLIFVFSNHNSQTKGLWPLTKEKVKDTIDIVPASDLRGIHRKIWIITTACLPWLTGTSVNPLLRAAYLAKDRPKYTVTLMVPWLNREEQDITYPADIRFDHPNDQEAYVRRWLIEDAHLPIAAEKLKIIFYSARYHDEYHSIFPMGDVLSLIPDEESDICILEEPEHLNWYRAPFESYSWMDKFNHVIGIVHTNYLSYARSFQHGAVKEPLLYLINQGMCRAYCHKIIKLSGALQLLAPEKEVISNVHGVRTKYLEIGDASSLKGFSKGAYFVGKLAWPKGLGEIFNLMNFVKKRTGKCFDIDIFGAGPHEEEIRTFAHKANLPATFFGSKDHAQLTDYKVFINPSLSEVLCTTIVEALAMGKWVVCADHPSNDFFRQFSNCLIFRTPEEFAANIYWALYHDPKPLTADQRYTLTWEAATERLLSAALLTKEMQANSRSFTDKFCRWTHDLVGSGTHGDFVRLLAGGRGASNQIEYVRQYGSAAPVVRESSLKVSMSNTGATTAFASSSSPDYDLDSIALSGDKSILPTESESDDSVEENDAVTSAPDSVRSTEQNTADALESQNGAVDILCDDSSDASKITPAVDDEPSFFEGVTGAESGESYTDDPSSLDPRTELSADSDVGDI